MNYDINNYFFLQNICDNHDKLSTHNYTSSL